MKTGDAVREVMKLQKIGVNQLADKMGKSPRLVSERLGQDNISVKKLNEMLKLMNYKILIVPEDTGVGDNSFEIETPDGESNTVSYIEPSTDQTRPMVSLDSETPANEFNSDSLLDDKSPVEPQKKPWRIKLR